MFGFVLYLVYWFTCFLDFVVSSEFRVLTGFRFCWILGFVERLVSEFSWVGNLVLGISDCVILHLQICWVWVARFCA